MAKFKRTDRPTLLASISVAGDTGPPIFIFEGNRLPFRNITIDGKVLSQTYADFLSWNACIAMCNDVAGIDSTNF